MDIATAAAALDRNEYGAEGSKELFEAMKQSGLVAVFGASDDLMEFRGAINDEVYPRDGGEPIGPNGVLKSKCNEGDECPYFALSIKDAPRIEAIWDDGSGYAWTYRTTIPHAKFRIVETDDEDEELYCEGIVFSLAALQSEDTP